MNRLSALVGLGLGFGWAFAIASPVSADDPCATALTALGQTGEPLACVAGPLGVGIAPDVERAGQLSRLGQAGENRFRTHFGGEVGRYAVIQSQDPGDAQARKEALKAAGFQTVLPWFSQDDQVSRIEAAVRASAEGAARRQGLAGGAVTAAGDQAVLNGARQRSRLVLDAREAGVVPHELGHAWYTRGFWPTVAVEGSGHYGGPGPDWLDEVSALLMEGGDASDERRNIFRDIYQGRGAGMWATVSPSGLTDLTRFLSRDHPTKAAPELLPTGAAASGGVAMRVITSGDAQGMASVLDAALYYPQGRMFADFLIDRTGDPAVFQGIAQAFARDESFEDWLEASGSNKGLPGSVEALDEAWKQWLSARFGPAGAFAPAPDKGGA